MDRYTKGKLYSALDLSPQIIEEVKQIVSRKQYDLVVSLGSKEYTRRRRSQVAAEAGRIKTKRGVI